MRVALPSLGRSGRTGRHRPVDPEEQAPRAEQDTPAEQGDELESYLAALAPEPGTETTLGGDQFGGPKAYKVALTPIANEQLRELAELRGTTPRELIQEWVQERLAFEANQQLGT